ncbi:MAG: DUF2339 domain-containing protein [Candidatus Woesearchaeota archaeon]|nr:DUF2339 domain-containing protein [Candidatus Woesearchaeota archaeon]
MAVADDVKKLAKNQAALQKNLVFLKKRIAVLEDRLDGNEPADEPIEIPADAKLPATGKETAKPIENLGFKVFGGVGFFLIFLGLFFLYDFAVDNGWIGYLGQISLGVLASILIIAIGEVFRRKEYEKFSQLLTGGGLGLLYFTFFATYFFPEYKAALGMTFGTVAILLTFVVLVAVALALRSDSMILAVFAFFLGYLSAFFAFTEGATHAAMLYIILLGIGLAFLATKKQWSLAVAPVVLSYLFYAMFFFEHHVSRHAVENGMSVGAHVGYALLLFVLFNLQTLFLKDDEKHTQNVLVAVINAALFFAFMFDIVWKLYPSYKGMLPLVLAVVYLCLGFIAKQRELNNLFETLFVICITALTITIPIQLDGPWITLAWALEGLLLVRAGVKIEHVGLRILGYIVLGIAFVRALFYDSWTLAFGWRTLTMAATACAMYLAAWCISNMPEPDEQRYMVESLLAVLSLVLITVMFAVEITDSAGLFSAMNDNSRLVLLSVVWAVEAIGLTFFGFKNKIRSIRIVGLVLFGITIVKVLILDISELAGIYRTVVTMIVGCIALVGAFVYIRNKEKIQAALE